MCRLGGIQLGWINNQTLNAMPKSDRYKQMYAMKLDTDYTLVSNRLFIIFELLIYIFNIQSPFSARQQLIEKMESDVLRGVYRQFAQHVFQKIRFPLYDQIYGEINDEIVNNLAPGFVAVASWLSAADQWNAVHYPSQNPPPEISQIIDPRLIRSPTYPDVDTNFFFNFYHNSN